MTTYKPVFRRPARTVSGVLKQAHEILAAEGRWIQGGWVSARGSGVYDPEAPLCGSWAACADGAILATVLGLPVYEDGPVCRIGGYGNVDNIPDATDEQVTLIRATRRALGEQIAKAGRPSAFYANDPIGNIYRFNDHTTRTAVLDVFWKAYRHAQYTERVAREQARERTLYLALAGVA